MLGAPTHVLSDWEAEPTCTELEVMTCNATAVAVYQACQWTLLLGQGAVLWQGISAVEISAALSLLRVKRADWLDTQQRVAVMVATARPLLGAAR